MTKTREYNQGQSELVHDMRRQESLSFSLTCDNDALIVESVMLQPVKKKGSEPVNKEKSREKSNFRN